MFSETQFLVRIKIIKPSTQDIIICIGKIERCSLCYTCYLMLFRYLSAIDMSEWYSEWREGLCKEHSGSG